MRTVQSQKLNVALRAMEPSDVEFMYGCENAPDIMAESSLLAPISRHALMQLVNSSFLPITESGQLRLIVMLLPTRASVGIADLFGINLITRTASVGIAIHPAAQRHQGYGQRALEQLEAYALGRLNLRALYAEVRACNEPSLRLFTQANYKRVGTKFAWLKAKGSDGWDDAVCFQKMIGYQAASPGATQ